MLVVTLVTCAPVSRASVASLVDAPNDPILRGSELEPAGDPLRCTERAAPTSLKDVFEAAWSPDSRTLAVSHIVTIPNHRTITGYEEDQRLALLDVATGKIVERGTGSEPAWSSSGTYLSYWHDSDAVWVERRATGLPVAVLHPSQPNVRWAGDELFFFDGGEIHSWSTAGVQGVATVPAELAPRFPQDDVYFSADARWFTMTRYFQDGTTERYLGATKTGAMGALDDGGATYMEWSPVGDTLLLRSAATLTLRSASTGATLATVPTPPGTTHTWTADGRLLLGRIAPTVPGGNAFDRLALLGDASAFATLPNLLGARTFSPDGRVFAGASRTGLYSTELELYRCGLAADEGIDIANDPATKARAESIARDGRRFVRPATAAITQFVQGIHTGVDVAAPYGTLLVAADDGVVDAVGWVPVGGRRVCVAHAGGLESCDYHTALSLVTVGERVVRGQPVALMGMTGLTTGPHVHWEAKRDGGIVDPLGE